MAPVAPASGRESRNGWLLLGAAVLAGLLFLAVPYVWSGWEEGGGGQRVPLGSPGAPAQGAAPNVDLSSMTPREAADRLFNRVMTALGEGNQAEAQNFLPMAIDAYQLVTDLDADGHFHLALLQQAQGDHQGALGTAEAVLEQQPDHLLALYAAGEAARELGRDELAAEYHGHVVQIFDTESERDLPEYLEHESFLPTVRQVATEFMAGQG